MPTKKIIKKAKADARQGKSASTQAGEFVKDEIHRIRAGKHGARSAKQAIAIGLSEARRAGVKIPKAPVQKKKAKKTTHARKAAPRKASSETSARRSRASLQALKREPTSSVSPQSMSRFAKNAAKKRSPISRSQSAKRAAYTRAHHLA